MIKDFREIDLVLVSFFAFSIIVECSLMFIMSRFGIFPTYRDILHAVCFILTGGFVLTVDSIFKRNSFQYKIVILCRVFLLIALFPKYQLAKSYKFYYLLLSSWVVFVISYFYFGYSKVVFDDRKSLFAKIAFEISQLSEFKFDEVINMINVS